MCETKFFQMCSFSSILTSLHSFLNLSFPLLFYVISTAIPKFRDSPWFTVIPRIFRISTQIPWISIPFLAFLPLFSAFSSFCSPIPHFGFYI